MNFKKLSNNELATRCRELRNEMRPLMDELRRRGFTISEKHGHASVPVTGFENICISKPTLVKL